ncbi:MAG: hypothetical protein KatS3mg009_1571 [Acidimicrobiia bacterium]|nr:MAG: hypothetical protein KatS3mg009_1571 [Acidimicrobiia bacterium]
MPRACAIEQAWSGPAPPNATSARSRGSTPRATVTARTASSIAASTTATTPAASTPARASAARAAPTSRRPNPGNAACGSMRPSTQVRVGDRGVAPAAPVAGRAGHRARAARPDGQRAARVEGRDRAPARADRVHVERGEPDREAADDALRRRLGDAAAHEAHVGARPAHVEGHRVREPARACDGGRGAHAAGRARQQQRRGQARGLARGDEPARRGHHQHRRRDAVDRPEVRRARRAQERVDDGRDHPLVLAELRGHLVRRDRVEAARPQRLRDRALVRGGEIGVQQAHRDRLDVLGQRGQAAVPGLQHRPVGTDAFRDLEPQLARHQRCGPVRERVVQRRAGLAGDLDHVGEAAGRHQRRARAAPLQQRVRRDGRAVRDELRARPAGERGHGAAQCPGRVVGRRQHLDGAAVVGDRVGEGPPGVDAEPHRRMLARAGPQPAAPRRGRPAPRRRRARRPASGSRASARCGSRGRPARSAAAAAACARRGRCGSAGRPARPARRARGGARRRRSARGAPRRAPARPATARPTRPGGAAARRRRGRAGRRGAGRARAARAGAARVRTRRRRRAPSPRGSRAGRAALPAPRRAGAGRRGPAPLEAVAVGRPAQHLDVHARRGHHALFRARYPEVTDAARARAAATTAAPKRRPGARPMRSAGTADADRGDDRAPRRRAPARSRSRRRARARRRTTRTRAGARPRARRRARRSGHGPPPRRAAPCRPTRARAASPPRGARCRAGRSRARATRRRCAGRRRARSTARSRPSPPRAGRAPGAPG